MPSLTCYRLRSEAQYASDFDDFVEWEDHDLSSYGPVAGPDFEAKLYVASLPPHPPDWASVLADPFPDAQIAPSASAGALLIVRLEHDPRPHFAFTFGVMGRFLLREGTWERGYGLRTALNLIYPHQDGGELDSSRLIALDAKSRREQTFRSRRQASRATTFEAFDLDRSRDVMNAATGRPADSDAWGTRVSGADPLHFGAELAFDELGTRCRAVREAHDRTDYRERFAWLDHIQPATDIVMLERLEAETVRALKEGDIQDLDLAPPEIIDWTRVSGFRYHFEAHGKSKVTRPDLRLEGYLAGLSHEGGLSDLDSGFLRSRQVSAVDADGHVVRRWSIWRSLTGEVVLDGATYILDEGDFFAVAQDYLEELNGYIDGLSQSSTPLPAAGSMQEGEYNQYVAESSENFLLLDRKTVSTGASTTPVEICDLLTRDRQLVHVKRHVGARDLSHLFSQGFVSADLLQRDQRFREAVQKKIREVGSEDFAFFDPAGIRTSDFEVIYAIAHDWRGRTLAKALPFFSKVNLRRTAQDLGNRAFRLSYRQVATISKKSKPKAKTK